ncbi:hypothetical protein KC359_g120 [Hortaea werneckii]|nr:hypothetical protein KC359_g120 [Hortaea werneckii]
MSISFAASGARMGIWHFHPNDPPTPTCFTRSLPFSLPTNTTPLHKFECVQNLGVHIQSIQSRPPCRKLLPFIDASRACSHAFCGECAWLRNVGYTADSCLENVHWQNPAISVQFLVKCGVLQRCRPIFKEETVDERLESFRIVYFSSFPVQYLRHAFSIALYTLFALGCRASVWRHLNLKRCRGHL